MNKKNRAELKKIVQSFIDDFEIKSQSDLAKFIVEGSAPVVWQGDADAYFQSEKKIITVGINPSEGEFSECRFRALSVLGEKFTADTLTDSFNEYFDFNPNVRQNGDGHGWFDDFEKLLDIFDAAYFSNTAKNTALHVYGESAIATKRQWGKLAAELGNDIKRLSTYGLFRELFAFLQPDIVLFSAGIDAFYEVFPELERTAPTIYAYRSIERAIYVFENGKTTYIWGRGNVGNKPFGAMTNDYLKETFAEIIDKIGVIPEPRNTDMDGDGEKLFHKVFGEGRVISCDDNNIIVSFEGVQKTFAADAVEKGYLSK